MAYAGSVNGTHHRRRGMRGLTLLAVVVLMLPAPTRAPAQACLGDCNTNLQVTIDELVRGVTIALAQAALSTCPSFDGDHSGAVEVYELVSAVNNSLAGCSAAGNVLPTKSSPIAISADNQPVARRPRPRDWL